MKKKDEIILPLALTEKFKKALSRRRVILLSAACGYGKTTAAHALLQGRRVLALSAMARDFALPKDSRGWDVLFLDDMQELLDPSEQQAVSDLIREKGTKRFVLATRGSVVPGWLMQFQFAGLMEVITADDLRLDRDCVRAILARSGVTVSDEVLDAILKNNAGYPLAVSTLARRMQAGGGYTSAAVTEGRLELYRYWDSAIFERFPPAIQSFCLALSLFDSFTADLARMVTGEKHASGLIEQLQLRCGMLRSDDMTHYCFLPHVRNFLLWKLEQNYSDDQKKSLCSRAGLYFELRDDYRDALDFYTRGGDLGRVSRILEKNARTHVGMGHYQEMADYYHALPEKEVRSSPALMQGMSMLCALETNYEESERWYEALRHYHSDRRDKEVRGRLAWLDVCLPQRGVNGLTKTIPNISRLMSNREISVGAMSVTSMLPSIMNGGKDFSPWSGKDDLLYATIRIPVEGMLGKDGVGLADIALTESKFEKGEDVSARVLALMTRLSEVQQKGTPDMEFALVGLVARAQAESGHAADAWNTISSIRARFEEKGLTRFLPNMDAMLCRLALRTGNDSYVSDWYEQKAPKDPFHIWIMRRYQYFTEAMVELVRGEEERTLMTLSPLESYLTACSRFIDGMHFHLLCAIARFRLGNAAWRDDLNAALDAAGEYHFVRTVGQYGGAILPLLEQCGWKKDTKFMQEVMASARTQTTCYSRFLEQTVKLHEPLTPAELRVLRMMCDDRSNQEIADALGVKLGTVKTQVRSIYHKMHVNRRSEAKTAVEKLRLL